MRVDPHLHRQTRAVDMLVQRTQITRQHVGQHRHHAVREIGRIATLAGLAVQRGIRTDIIGDIGDRDPDEEAAGVFRVSIRLGINRIVAVAGINRVDGQQRQATQVFAFAQRCRLRRIGLGNHRIGELIGDAVLVDRNQADRARAIRVTQAGRDAGLRQAKPLWPHLFRLNQLAITGVKGVIARNFPFFIDALVDRDNPAALGIRPEHPQQFQRV